MRIYEFVDAEAQLALLRMIMDNTWAAIDKQAEEQRRAEEQRKAKAKLKPIKRKQSKGRAISLPTLSLPPPPPKPKVADPQPKSQPNSQLPTTQQKLSQPYNGAVSRLNNASFGVKSHTLGGDNGL
jgi:hypothetical protein